MAATGEPKKAKTAMYNYLLPLIPIVAISMIAIFSQGQRRTIAAVISTGYALHFALSDVFFYLDGVLYYASAVMVAAGLFTVVISLSPKTHLIKHIMTLMLLNVICQSVGWILYESYQDPMLYNVSVGVLNVFVIIRLLVKTSKDRDFGRGDSVSNGSDLGPRLPGNTAHNVGGVVYRCYHGDEQRNSRV